MPQILFPSVFGEASNLKKFNAIKNILYVIRKNIYRKRSAATIKLYFTSGESEDRTNYDNYYYYCFFNCKYFFFSFL